MQFEQPTFLDADVSFQADVYSVNSRRDVKSDSQKGVTGNHHEQIFHHLENKVT